MKNLLLSAAIGDIAGMPYEFENRTKNYNAVDLLLSSNTYTDDTVCTFACAEALIKNLNMAEKPLEEMPCRLVSWIWRTVCKMADSKRYSASV